MAERPGVMLYFDDWLEYAMTPEYPEIFNQLSRAYIIYAATGEVPELTGICKLQWPGLKAKADRDGMHYDQTILQRKYAGYCSAQERKKAKPLEWEEWLEQELSQPPDNDRQQPSTTVSGSQPNANAPEDVNAPGDAKTYSPHSHSNIQGQPRGQWLPEGQTDGLPNKYGTSDESSRAQIEDMKRRMGKAL